MNRLAFWNAWDKSHRLTFNVLGSAVTLLVILTLIIQWGDISYFYRWQMTGYLEEVLLPFFSDHSAFIESIIHFDTTLIFQKIGGSYRLLSPWMVYLFLGVFYLSLTGALTMMTYLSRFWYLVSIGLFILLIHGAGFDKLGLMEISSQWISMGVALPFIGLTYYFQAIREDTSTAKRFLLLLLLMILLGIIVWTSSTQTTPFLYLGYYTYWPALILSVAFILLVGHEIVHAILTLTTQNSKEGEQGNTLHFVIFSLVYLANVAMVYLRNFGYIDWDMYYIDVFLLLTISAGLGLWGLKKREILYGNILSFYPYVAYLYLSLACITFATIIFVSLSGNDPVIEVIEDAIIFGHLGFGGSFFVYIIVNFIGLMVKNLPIHKIAYRESNFPYATSRLGGLIAVAGFFFASNYASFYQAGSGYLNLMGDLSLMSKYRDKAIALYDRGSRHGNFLNQSNDNHKSNYMLGVLEKDKEKSIPYFKNAISKKPTEQAYTSLGVAYEESNSFFEAVFTYQKGLKEFPDSWAIQNNLALLYNRTEVLDSTQFYLTNIETSSWKSEVVHANLLAVVAKHQSGLEPSLEKESDRVSVRSNTLAYQITNDKVAPNQEVITQETPVLNLFTYSYVNNLGIACLKSGSTAYLEIIDPYLENPYNGDFKADLAVLKGANHYTQGEVSKAFEYINVLRTEYNQMEGELCALLGKWSMELGQPLLAQKYFELAREAAYPMMTTDLAHNLALRGEHSVAQYILNNEYEQIDIERVQLRSNLKALEAAIGRKETTWGKGAYDFQREREQLTGLKSSTAAADAYRVLGLTNPFYEEGVLESAKKLNTELNDQNAAYEILLNAIVINEYSAPLIKAYINQCLQMGLVNYAESTIIRLYDILSPEEFSAYELQFEEMKSNAEARLNNW